MSGKKNKRIRKAALAIAQSKYIHGSAVGDAEKELKRLKRDYKDSPHNLKPVR